MANSGSGTGTKFVSVNLNKLYGQPSHSNHPSHNGSYGQATSYGRGRGGTGGGSGGMVVLSRSRASQKPVPKLSVPAPLNLPSLRKEHERFDVTGSGSGLAGGSGTGAGTRPGSSGMGWTKPVSIGSQEKNGNLADASGEQGRLSVDGESRAGVAYMPPSARSSGTGVGVPGASTAKSFPQLVEKAVVLRGEDFPSLQAALPALSGLGIKHKDSLNQKQKQVSSELTDQQGDGNHVNSAVDMRPQAQASRHAVPNGLVVDQNGGHGSGDLHMINHSRKEECFPGLLPIIRLNPRSDWADDERDTGHAFVDHSKDFGNSKSENYWDSEFDMPKASVFAHKSVHNQHERLGQRDDESGRSLSSELFKLDPFRRDTGAPNRDGRDGSAGRSSSLHRDGVKAQDDKNNMGTRVPNKDILKENRYISPYSGASSKNTSTSRYQESIYGRRDVGHVQDMRQQWNSRRAERIARDRYGTDFSSRHRNESFQNVTTKKFSFASGSKLSSGADSIFSREKHTFSKTERSYIEDPFIDSAGFDERDPFSGSLLGVIKRKKDTVKQTDFHDPVRESFEAELERVQQMQELERQRIIEEQERASEQARREEEERQRLILEEEERQRRLEEEAREAAYRAEQEQLEAARKEEELKMARKEEKRIILLEEERRKQAAYQKLLELEARIAKRGADSGNTDASSARTMDNNSFGKDKDVSSSPAELDAWEDSERMVERITASASSDSPLLNRSFDITSRPYPTREGPSSFLDKGKPLNSWRRDIYENGNNVSSQPLVQEISHLSPRRDSFSNCRIAPRKEFYGGPGYMSSRYPVRGMMQDPYADEFGHQKDQRWNFPGEAESYSRTRDMELEFQDNPSEKYSDFGWGQNRFRSNTHVPFPERHYPNSEFDEHSPYGRSRYPVRQPRVLPPPLMASTQKSSFHGANDSPGTSGFLEKDDLYSHKGRIESTGLTGYYTGHQDSIDKSDIVNMESELKMTDDPKLQKDMTPRCDSQSSVSVSSPPNSPPHLSHDELDESGDSPLLSSREGNQVSPPSRKEEIINDNPGQRNMMTASSSISGVEDDEWAVENNNKLQEQEEYDEDEDGYQEEDEAHEGDTHNIDLKQDFDDLHLEDKNSSHLVENSVLGFDDGVEVEIPSDDFERNLCNEEGRGPGIPGSSACTVGVRLVDDVQGDGGCYGQIDGSSQPTVEHDHNKAMQGSVVQSTGDPYTLTTTDGNVHSAKQTVSILSGTASSACLTPISAGPSQDIPVKLQFGLFSGPSLIPSPVPAIQIGSIQMPLHLHPPVGTALAHIHQPQPPMFQFGQLRYNTPISQGLLPIPPQSMSFVQPSVTTLNRVIAGNSVQLSHDPLAQSAARDDVPSLALKNQHSVCGLGPVDQSLGNPSLGFTSSVVREMNDDNVHKQISAAIISGSGNAKQLESESVAQTEVGEKNDAVLKHPLPLSRGRLSEPQLQNQQITGEPFSETTFGGMKPFGSLSASKGKRFTYAVKNSSRSFPPSDLTGSDVNGFQRRSRRVHRTEFRVQENGERRTIGNFARSGSKRFVMSGKPTKQVANSEGLVAAYSNSQEINSTNQVRKEVKKDLSLIENLSGSGEGNLKRNIPEEDVDAPLQSGVVRVFKQPGIETHSDEDDFIEVRSKRQMLNDRREQREKEIKAKSRVTKLSRKPRATNQTTSGLSNSRKVTRRESSQNHCSHFASSEGRGLVYKELSVGVLSQTLAPIGTPAVKPEAQADKRSQITPIQSNSLSIVAEAAKDHISAVMFENKSKAVDNVPTPLNSWDNSRINHQVMTLTQTQLEEAMKPPRYDVPIASVGGHSSASSEPLLPSSSILSKERSFSSVANPINSLLAGERIQFGAVTSPTVLPPSSRAPGSSRSEMQISHKLSADEDDCTLFFEKDEQADNSCAHLQDSEAEAEAAASAVAVAAISTDEVVVNGLGHVSISDSKNFGGVDGIPTGIVDQQLANQSRAEESLTVSLPADLSLETPSIPLWPTISSPQSSSSQMLSHFPGGPPSHFPFYEMNPMMRAPFFAFGPQEESSASKSQPQKSNPASSSSPLGTWQQCHSTVDSFYGTPTITGPPFMNHHGVQGPPHMVVYNHFAPVGQFGQVGLSFMGPAYIPSGKPPDWKHNAPSSAVVMGDGDMNNSSIAPAHQNIVPGSTLLPMPPSAMAMFDVPPFQTAPDIPVQARWSHVSASPLHAVSLTRPHQQQADSVVPSQFSHIHSMPRGSALSEKGANFCLAAEASPSQLTEELSMGDSSRSAAAGTSAQTAVGDSSSVGAPAEVGKTNNLRNSSNNNSEGHSNSSGFKTQSTQQKMLSAQQSHSTNYNFQRGGAMGSQRNNSGSEWSQRRMGFHGRNQSFGVEKGFPSSKMKQVYVAKQTSGTSTRE